MENEELIQKLTELSVSLNNVKEQIPSIIKNMESLLTNDTLTNFRLEESNKTVSKLNDDISELEENLVSVCKDVESIKIKDEKIFRILDVLKIKVENYENKCAEYRKQNDEKCKIQKPKTGFWEYVSKIPPLITIFVFISSILYGLFKLYFKIITQLGIPF